MSPTALEFSIAQLADGTLPVEDRAALEALIARDPEAAALLVSFRAIDAELKASPVPAVNWDRLALHVAAVVSQHAGSVMPEPLEAAIADHAGGTLPESEQAAVVAALETNPSARLMLGDYQAVDAALKDSSVPSIHWDRLSQTISDAVTRQANTVLTEDVEFAIAQYADGTLADNQVVEIEARLADDAFAREALADYQRVDSLMKAGEMPAVNWNALADRLSQLIDDATAVVEESRVERFLIGNWMRPPVWMAAAASVVLAVGAGAWLLRHGGNTSPTPGPRGPELAQVVGPTVERATGEVVGQITFGPPTSVAELPEDDLISRPSRTIVSGSAVAERNGAFFP